MRDKSNKKQSKFYIWIQTNKKIVAAITAVFCVGIILFVTLCSVYGVFQRWSISIENRKNGEVRLENGIYQGDIRGGRFDGTGKLIFDSGVVYSGDWVNFEMSGYGVLLIPDKGTYEGEYKNSVKAGNGKFSWTDGDVYEGNFANDKMDGTGKYTFSNGDSLVGAFKDNIFISGTYNFNNDIASGSCSIKNSNFVSAQIIFNNGTKYNGAFNGKIDGQGEIVFASGDSYNGRFQQGVRCGKGTYAWSNGDKYVGGWDSDKMNGNGQYTFNDGFIVSGIFEDNRPIKNVVCKYYIDGWSYSFQLDEENNIYFAVIESDNGVSYEGDVQLGFLTGQAEIIYSKNGGIYVGTVIAGKREGEGVYTWSNGSSYEGEWVEDKMEGLGSFYYPQSSSWYKLSGTFVDNKPNGQCELYRSDDLEDYCITIWENGKCTKVVE